jgi:hypothetical protein
MEAHDKAKLAGYLADAKEKLASLPERIAAEREAAANDDPPRQPFPIRPLTEVEPAPLAKALGAITSEPDGALKETVKTWTRVCSRQTAPFAVYSDQLAAVLALAGIE